jgi:hypothetical protein
MQRKRSVATGRFTAVQLLNWVARQARARDPVHDDITIAANPSVFKANLCPSAGHLWPLWTFARASFILQSQCEHLITQ